MDIFYYNYRNRSGLDNLINSKDKTKLFRIRIDEYDARTLEQNDKIHAMLSDIAKQAKHLNQVLGVDDWKRLCVKQFGDDCISQNIPRLAEYWTKNQVRLMPSLDGGSLVALGQQTRDFPKYVAAGFITWLYAYGVNNDVIWSEPEPEFDERYAA